MSEGWRVEGKSGEREREGYLVVGGAREQVQWERKKNCHLLLVNAGQVALYVCCGGSGESKGCKKKVSF